VNSASEAVAAAFIDEFLISSDWQQERERWGWSIIRIDPLTLVVSLQARPIPEVKESFTIRLSCECCPGQAPDVRFVNPESFEYDPSTDHNHVAILEAPDCRTHLYYEYPAPYQYSPQLVCTSMGRGYYVSNHTPTADQQWNPQRHSIGTTIAVVQRSLLHPVYYQGRFK
jgi:hypothetical protein